MHRWACIIGPTPRTNCGEVLREIRSRGLYRCADAGVGDTCRVDQCNKHRESWHCRRHSVCHAVSSALGHSTRLRDTLTNSINIIFILSKDRTTRHSALKVAQYVGHISDDELLPETQFIEQFADVERITIHMSVTTANDGRRYLEFREVISLLKSHMVTVFWFSVAFVCWQCGRYVFVLVALAAPAGYSTHNITATYDNTGINTTCY